jgi:hypothetical protein
MFLYFTERAFFFNIGYGWFCVTMQILSFALDVAQRKTISNLEWKPIVISSFQNVFVTYFHILNQTVHSLWKCFELLY